jgi:hypothetical protein
MILRLLCIWLVFYSLLSSLMHGTMNLKYSVHVTKHSHITKTTQTHTLQHPPPPHTHKHTNTHYKTAQAFYKLLHTLHLEGLRKNLGRHYWFSCSQHRKSQPRGGVWEVGFRGRGGFFKTKLVPFIASFSADYITWYKNLTIPSHISAINLNKIY